MGILDHVKYLTDFLQRFIRDLKSKCNDYWGANYIYELQVSKQFALNQDNCSFMKIYKSLRQKLKINFQYRKFNMRLLCWFIFCFLTHCVFSQIHNQELLKTDSGNNFYFIGGVENNRTIIFLHGGVNNPYFKQSAKDITLDFILENNRAFLDQAVAHNFNVILPITNPNLNWLDKPEEVFIELKKMVSQSIDNIEEIYIGGFSDGGTGSFKIFYQNPDYFKGLIVFNGYPQHKNFYSKVNYDKVRDKKIIFLSTFKDDVIPYEFLLTEYVNQKRFNPNTFMYVTSGGHSFADYKQSDIVNVFDILMGKVQNKDTFPIHGFIKNDSLVTLYPFKKKIVRNYNFGREVYEENRQQQKRYKNKN